MRYGTSPPTARSSMITTTFFPCRSSRKEASSALIRSVMSCTSPAFFSMPLMLITDITVSAIQPYRQKILRMTDRFFRHRKSTAAVVTSTHPVFSSTFSRWLEMAVSNCSAEEMNP